jgi:hypothetical protein
MTGDRPVIKALTICQPYAELIARGDKPIENRTWPTSYRGLLLIHAGKSHSWLDDDDLQRFPSMSFGAVVALTRLVDCVRVERLPPELASHEHANGPWCWVLQGTIRMEPIGCNGAQGLWVPSDDVIARVRGEAAYD